MSIFFEQQSIEDKSKYIKLLQMTGGLSNLFSSSETPYLYYRAMESIFCKAFNANDLSRGDTSADASKKNTGIGLKTFLHNNGKTYQKIAEFNRDSGVFREIISSDSNQKKQVKEIVEYVANSRNNRLLSTMRIHNLENMIYHNITRQKNEMLIYEEVMDLIDIQNIANIKKNKNTIIFEDGKNEYNFSLSKSTLLKRFIARHNKSIIRIPITILSDPFDFLLDQHGSLYEKNIESFLLRKEVDEDYIILPLYSTQRRAVMERSGLNMWNASGRPRHPDEVYIPIPAWIHDIKNDFFNYSQPYDIKDRKTDPFKVELPNGQVLSMRVVQQGGKGLSSDPNSELGKWILRDVLQLKENVLVTMKMLEDIGIDSVKLTKQEDNKYRLDFLKLGSFEDYQEELNIEVKK